MMIAITGANGNLGRLVVKGLLQVVPATQIVAGIRKLEDGDWLRALGVQVREADYDRPETLLEALHGVEKLLLISAVVPGQRLRQHKAVIDAAKQAGVKFVAYTSMLRADTSTLNLAGEHKATEAYLKHSGLEYVLLRNAWYLENTTAAIVPALAQGAMIGCAGEGRFASATRADYAAAAVAVLTQPGHANRTYELAGDQSFSMAEFAAEVSKQTGQAIAYKDLPPAEYEAALTSAGLPRMIVDVIIDADSKASHGELDSTSRDLSRLLGRNTTHFAEAIKVALQR
jgi:NAD(P)H dehydrogenase (quinone)